MMNQDLSSSPATDAKVDALLSDTLAHGELREEHELVLPKHKRMVAQYTTTEAGTTELHLHYNDKEIEFDDPALFAFGETLTRQSSFLAGSATGWGEGYEWPQVRELLETLMEEGILQRAAASSDPVESERGTVATMLPPGPCPVACHWFELESISQDLLGRSIEVGYLECIVPITRVAHMCLDADGRQVGEANIFPPRLRLDIPTEWRTCPQPGSRYLDPKPMNVTALKAMRIHWRSMMTLLAKIREAYVGRYPELRATPTIGHLQRLAALVLAIPAYLLLRGAERVENGELHPVLSSMFRVTDGVHMTMSLLLFSSMENGPLPPATRMSSTAIRDCAERNDLFHSNYGVCAGPNAMIEEFLQVLVDGAPPAQVTDLSPPLDQVLRDLDEAFDYGLHGLQTQAVLFSLWPLMGQAYEQLLHSVNHWPGTPPLPLERLVARLRDSLETLRAVNGEMDAWQASRELVYTDMYAQCAHGLGGKSPSPSLAACLTPHAARQDAQAADQLRAALVHRLRPTQAVEHAAIVQLVRLLMNYCKQEQAVVRSLCQSQQCINRLLERAPPTRPLVGWDLQGYYRLQAKRGWQAYLLEDLADTLSVRIEVSADRIDVRSA